MQGDKAKGVFLSTISWSPETILFSPNESQIMEEIINNTVEGVIGLANVAPRLLFMRLFSQYFDGRPTGLNVNNIVRTAPQMVDLRQTISECIKQDFVTAQDYVKVFEEYREIHKWGQTWTIEKWAEKPQSVESVKSLMARQRARKDKLERMKVRSRAAVPSMAWRSVVGFVLCSPPEALHHLRWSPLDFCSRAW